MKENKIPTAKEFALHYFHVTDEEEHEDVANNLKKFAKLHVKAALASAAENAESITDIDKYIYGSIVDKGSILSAYPEELIK